MMTNTTHYSLWFCALVMASIMPEMAFAQSAGDGLLEGVTALFTSNGAVFLGLVIATIGLLKWIFGDGKGLWMMLGGLVITAIPGLFDSSQDAFEQLFAGAGITTRGGGGIGSILGN